MRKEGWKGHLNAFLTDIEAGKYDPDLNEPEPVPSSPSAKQETSTNGETLQANGTDSTGAPEDSKPTISTDDAMQFNVEPDDEGGDQDAARDANGGGRQNSDAKRPADRGEEISIPPEGNQVMIRTIPPDIGRVKLEEVSLISRRPVSWSLTDMDG